MKILLIAYDNHSMIHTFPQGIAYIAAAIKEEGHHVDIYNQDVHHYTDEHLTTLLDRTSYDVVGLSVIGGYYQYKKLLDISKAINNSKHRPPYYILGGHGPSPEPEYFLQKSQADIAVIGEGEKTIRELLKAIENNEPLSGIKGIAYRDGHKITINKERPLLETIDDIPWPAYDLFPMEYYRLIRMPNAENDDFVMSVLSGRGCTFKCNFCYRMDKGFRPRSKESIIEEITFLHRDYGINYIDFSDELLMSSQDRTIDLCNAFIESGIGFKWTCNGRLNYATPKVLSLMKKSGCVYINYGIESFDDKVLKNMNKALTTRQITTGVEATLQAGISPGLNIIFGNIGDNAKTLQQSVDFLLKYDNSSTCRTIRPVTPYPGSPLYYYAIENGLLKDVEDFYEHKHVNSDLASVNFTDLSDDDFHKCLMDANNALLDNYYGKLLQSVKKQCRHLYMDRNSNFRGFRQT
jgi:radical SAM superfamily enzyme YgiQ (UPF0313 family)